MSHNINNNLFTDDWAVCGYHGFGINWYRVVLMSHQTVSLEKYWKLFPTTSSRESVSEASWQETGTTHRSTFLLPQRSNLLPRPFFRLSVFSIFADETSHKVSLPTVFVQFTHKNSSLSKRFCQP